MAHINDIANITGVPAAVADKVVNELACKKIYDDTVTALHSLDKRPKIYFSRALNQDQVAMVSKAYPEFNVQFTGVSNSVHNLAGGLRALELEWMMTQIPYGYPTYDIGGNFFSHMMKGRAYVHCCNPMLDIRDIARVQNHHESVRRYIAKHSIRESAFKDSDKRHPGFLKAIPSYQLDAFQTYHEHPEYITCNDVFEECKIPCEESNYAVSLHSLYDIDADKLAPALLRKNVRTMYAAFHMSEEIAMGYREGTLPSIGAVFTRIGDDILFTFNEESTLAYKHKFRNLMEYTCRTFFPASTRYVYFKEFLCSRVDTKFVKFSLVDTFCLNRNVFSNFPLVEDTLDDCWQRSSLSCTLAEKQPIFTDKALMSVWFPKGAKCVLVPIFEGFFERSHRVTQTWELVDKTFVYTVLNHIQTYQPKQLTYQNVLSFCESIRSRVVVNGTSVRSEWEIPLELIGKLALSLFVIAKFNMAKAESVCQKFSIKKKGFFGLLKSTFDDIMDDYVQPMSCWLIEKGYLTCTDDRLEIKDVDLVLSFTDSIRLTMGGVSKPKLCEVSEHLVASEKLYVLASEISKKFPAVSFDQEKFRKFCESLQVDAEIISKVLAGLTTGDFGITIAGLSSGLSSEAALAQTFSDPVVDQSCIVKVKSNLLPPEKTSESVQHFVKTDEGKKKRKWVEKASLQLPMAGVSGEKPSFMLIDDDGVETDLSTLNGKLLSEFKALKKKVIGYSGSLKVQQMKNAVDYYAATVSATLNNLQKLAHDYVPEKSKGYKSFGIYDCGKNSWVLEPPVFGHCWGVAVTDKGDSVVYLSHDKEDKSKLICPAGWKRIAVCQESMLFSSMKILERISGTEIVEPNARFILVDGVPGCGKSAEIVERCDLKRDLVLCAGRSAADMLRRRLNHIGKGATTSNVRTIDSFLMNPSPLKFDRVWVDEGLMTHTGIINFCALFTQAKELYIFGDTKQIPFLNRVMDFDYPERLKSLVVDEVQKRSVTKRCPLDVTVHLNSVYQRSVTSSSNVERSVSCENLLGGAVFKPDAFPENWDCTLVLTQAEKTTLKQRGFKKVHTVHEVQGETFKDVAMVRLDPTQLAIAEKGSPHLLVALTRHTHRLVYYTVKLDAMSSCIDNLANIPSFMLQTFRVDSAAK